MQLSFLDKTVLNLILHLYFLTKNVIHACFTTMRCLGNKPVKISYWARTTVTFPIDDHYNILAPTLKIYPTIFFLNSQKMTDPLRHLVCEIRENDIPPFRTNCFKAWGPCISAMKFPGFSNMSTSCLTATVSLCNWYTYWQMASFQSLDATVHKNITSTHSYTQFLLSQINPICTMNFFLGTLYVCNGGWILTVVRALINFRHITNRHEGYTKSKKNLYLDKPQKEIHIAMQHINWYVTEACPRMWW